MTVKGDVMHKVVHDDSLVTTRDGIVTVRGISVNSEKYCISGVCDAVELIPDPRGIELQTRPGKWRIHPVEYKRGRPKENLCDELQLAAQCVCLEEMLCCDIPKASIFYGETKHRKDVQIDQSLRSVLKSTLEEMKQYYDRKYTPKVRKSKKCKNCSLNELCLPELESAMNVSDYILRHLSEPCEK